MTPHSYLIKAKGWTHLLRRKGNLIGLSRSEVNRIRPALRRDFPAIQKFKTVFVHSDVQKRHIGEMDGRKVLIDFDQAHYGNELEDWVYLATRHPLLYRKQVVDYLSEKFKADEDKSASLVQAISFFEKYLTLKGYYDRTIQWRAKPFDLAAKTYARIRFQTIR